MPTTIDVPIWYAGLAIVALPAIGWLAAVLRLTSKRDAVKVQIDELKRLTDWTPPPAPREAGHQPWPEPLSPRAHERAAAAAVVDAAPVLDLAPTEATVGAHAAPPTTPGWHRGENRPYTWPWLGERAARIASIGYRPRLVEQQHVPAHAAWNLPTGEFDEAVEKLVVEEKVRQQGAFERGLNQLFDDFVRMGGVR